MKQDPPSFSITPEGLYKEEAGGSLLIPCQGKSQDPPVQVSWSKVTPSNLQQVSIALKLKGGVFISCSARSAAKFLHAI